MSIKILTQNAIDNTNIDGARQNHFSAGMKSGIVKGAFNEGNFFASASNVITLDTCELRISGHQVLIDSAESVTLANAPTIATRYSLIAEIKVSDTSVPSFRLFVQQSNVSLIQQNLFKTEKGNGTYQLKIGNFTLGTDGKISDVVRVADLISGGGQGSIGDIKFNATATQLSSSSQPEVNVDYNEETGEYDMNLGIPAGSGTNVTVGGVIQSEFDADTKADKMELNKKSEILVAGNHVNSVGFDSDPQEQINDLKENSQNLGLLLGMIIPSAIVQEDAGLHLLDGSSLTVDGMYSEFCVWLTNKYNSNNSSVPVCTEQEWQEEVEQYGQCGKFVITSTYVRLPKITKFIEGISSISEIGTSFGAGLPNITGSWTASTSARFPNGGTGTGAITRTAQSLASYLSSTKETGAGNNGFELDASNLNPIYGNSATVQPQSTKYPYYIVVSTIKNTQIEVDVNNIINDVNNKADKDLSNVPYPELTPDGVEHQACGYKTYMTTDGQTWYIIHPTGKKECSFNIKNTESGTKTVNLPIEYENVPKAQVTSVSTSTSTTSAGDIKSILSIIGAIESITKDSITIKTASTSPVTGGYNIYVYGF